MARARTREVTVEYSESCMGFSAAYYVAGEEHGHCFGLDLARIAGAKYQRHGQRFRITIEPLDSPDAKPLKRNPKWR